MQECSINISLQHLYRGDINHMLNMLCPAESSVFHHSDTVLYYLIVKASVMLRLKLQRGLCCPSFQPWCPFKTFTRILRCSNGRAHDSPFHILQYVGIAWKWWWKVARSTSGTLLRIPFWALCGLGFQSLPDFVCFPGLILWVFHLLRKLKQVPYLSSHHWVLG